MSGYKLINAFDAKQRSLKENIQLVDIRDSNSFETAHAEGSFHLTNDTIADFMKEVEINRTVFVICYHGNSSKGVAQYLCDQGYLDVHSVNGGFEGWKLVE
jgi:thiosulfate sulfurtransferase